MVEIPVATLANLAFRRDDTIIRAVGLLSALALPWLLLVTRGWPELQDGLIRRMGPRSIWAAAVSGAAYGFAWSLISDGLALAHRVNGLAFGFDHQNWIAWLIQQLASTATWVLVGLILAPIGYALIARSPRHWPVWGGAIVSLLAVIYCVASPLLAKNAPLPQGPLKTEIQAMLRKAGAEKAPVVMQLGSGPCVGGTNLGVFPTTQIVIDDGYLGYPVAQGVEVAAHEVGHYVRHDPELGVLAGILWIFAVFAAMFWGGHYLVRKFGAGFDISTLQDPASLPLIIFCATTVYVAGLPAFNTIQRQIEHRADQFSMTLTGYGHAGAIGMVRDAKCWHLDPNPSWLETAMFETHPSIAERITFMNRYGPIHPLRSGGDIAR